MEITADETRFIDEVVDRARVRFPTVQPQRIRSVVDGVHHQYDGHPIREFIPVLVEREVDDLFEVEDQRGAHL
ncbi:MAG: hypothetical protein ABI776_02420 [Nocardioidaceae bacterium]